MKLRKLIIALAFVTSTVSGITLTTFSNNQTASAKTYKTKLGVPTEFSSKAGWVSEKFSYGDDKEGIKVFAKQPDQKFVLAMSITDNNNVVSQGKVGAFYFKYSTKVYKNTYILSTSKNLTKTSIEVQFEGQNKMLERDLYVKGSKVPKRIYEYTGYDNSDDLEKATGITSYE